MDTDSSVSDGGDSDDTVVMDIKSWRAGKEHDQRLEALLDGAAPAAIPYDVTFLVGPNKEEVKGHQFVLRLHSPYFETLFLTDKTRKTPLPLRKADPHGFKLFLKFLYTGRLTEAEKTRDALALLKCACQFAVADLEEICTNELLKFKSYASAAALLEDQSDYVKESLRTQALTYILTNAHRILPSPDFLKFNESSLHKILGSDDLGATSETQVFEALLRWSNAQYRLTELPSDLRFVANSLIRHIRFPVMDKSDFALVVAPSQLLTDAELVTIFRYFNVEESKRAELPAIGYSTVPRKWHKSLIKHPDPKEYYIQRLPHVALCGGAGAPDFMELTRKVSMKDWPHVPYTNFTHQIKIMVNQPVWINSIGLNSCPPAVRCAGPCKKYDVDSDKCVKYCVKLVETSNGYVTSYVNGNTLFSTPHINFPICVRIRPKIWYTLKLNITSEGYRPLWHYIEEGTGRTRALSIPERNTVVVMEFDEVLPLEYPTFTGLKQGLIHSIGFRLDLP